MVRRSLLLIYLLSLIILLSYRTQKEKPTGTACHHRASRIYPTCAAVRRLRFDAFIMSHAFTAFGTPITSSSGNPREHVSSEETRDVVGFHLKRSPSLSCEQDHGVQGQVGQVVEHHIPRGDGRATEERAYVGGTMELSPKRQPSPPFLKGGRKSKSGSDLDLNADDGATQSARRRSFGEGSSMTLQTNAAEIASDARASEEAKLWREQLLAAQQAPAAGATSVLSRALALEGHDRTRGGGPL